MKLIAWCTALLLLVGVAVALDDAGGDDAGPPTAPRPFALEGVELASASSLRTFEDCGALLDYFQAEASSDEIGSWSTFGGQEEMMAAADDSATSGEAFAGAGAAPAPTTTGPDRASRAASEQEGDADFSGTNLQEADVDEPDVVKTDGELILAVGATPSGQALQVIEPAEGGPRLLGTVDLPQHGSSELLLTGDRVTVLTRAYGLAGGGGVGGGGGGDQPSTGIAEIAPAGAPLTVLTTVDVTDRTSPRVVETRSFEGDYASARMTGTLARIVLRSQPSLGVPEPQVFESGDPEDLRRWTEDAIDGASLDAWLPSDDDGPVVACDAVARPEEPAGVGTVTVLTVDVAASLEPLDATAVVADAETVYASTDRLYVATTRWGGGCCPGGVPVPMPVEPDGGIGDTSESSVDSASPAVTPVTTDLHAFDTTGETTPYVGSGRVAGRLLNSFALSEHEGILRVATTIDSPDGRAASESAIATLAEEGGALVERGRLAGLGTTEQIYAVRYQGDVGYVVTFRQTDPLYTVDLSDPSAPRLLGELKIPGYSAYLHPAEDGRLLGVGQDATEEGRTQGSQVSTFDVSDLAAPTEEDRISFPNGFSPVEHEHRAFLWWAAERVAVVPLEVYPYDQVTGGPAGTAFLGAVAVEVGTDGTLTERGRVTHADHAGPERYASVSRSLVIDDTLYTLSEAGILASDLDTLADAGWLAF